MGNLGTIGTLLPLVLLVAIMYFLLIRPQKKREKQVNSMRSAIKVGDQVITIGGIRGKIVKTKEDILTIQVGSDKSKFEIMRWAISKVENADDEPITKAAETEEEAPKKKSAPKKIKKADAEETKEVEEAEEKPKKASKPKKIKKTEE